MTDKWIKGFLDQNLYEEAPLPQYFRAKDHMGQGTHWALTCKKCGKGWTLGKKLKGQDYHPGNLLHLLNHARSHK
jgi:hypothetical protein